MKIKLLSRFGQVLRERSLIFQRLKQRRCANCRSFPAFEVNMFCGFEFTAVVRAIGVAALGQLY